MLSRKRVTICDSMPTADKSGSMKFSLLREVMMLLLWLVLLLLKLML
jgi:hypothetical protein